MRKKKDNQIQYVKGDPAIEADMFNDMMGNGSITEENEDRYVDLSMLSDYDIKKTIKTSSNQTTPLEDKKNFNFANEIDRKAKIIKETDNAYILQVKYKRWNKERTGKDEFSILAWFPKNWPYRKVILKPMQEKISEGYSQKITIGKREPIIVLNSKDDKSINEGIKIKSRGVKASLNEDYNSQIKYANSIYDLNKIKQAVINDETLTQEEKDKLCHEVECSKSEIWYKEGKGLQEDKKIPSSVRRLIDIINGHRNQCEVKDGKLIVRNSDSRVGNTTFPITKEQERKLKELGYLQESLNEDKQETFTSKEANELSKEFQNYLYDLDTPKYYDVRVEKVNDDEYIIRVNIEYGDLIHDHKFLDEVAKEFFNNKGIDIMIYEPSELKSDIDEDNIYSSSHIIQKGGNKIYQVKKDDDFLEKEE